MQRATPGLFEELEPLIAAAAARHPQWLVLIESLRDIARATDDAAWEDAATRATLAGSREPEAPVLHRAELVVPLEPLTQLITQVTGCSSSGTEAVALLAEGIRTPSLVAMPLLHACAQVHHTRIPPHWPHGYCPVCGAWPILAELVGIDRSRRLRCGRCASGWAFPPLKCAFCGEHHHARLGSLVPEATRETRYIETCASCGGYLKTLTTLSPFGWFELMIKDLDTVELDLVALERGCARPAELGYPIEVTVIA